MVLLEYIFARTPIYKRIPFYRNDQLYYLRMGIRVQSKKIKYYMLPLVIMNTFSFYMGKDTETFQEEFK